MIWYDSELSSDSSGVDSDDDEERLPAPRKPNEDLKG